MGELEQVRVFCGIYWAGDHHDKVVVDESGALKAQARIDDTIDGLNELLQILAEHGDTAENPIPVAIQTSHGLLVAVHYARPPPCVRHQPRQWAGSASHSCGS